MPSLKNQSYSLFFGKTTALIIQMLTSVIIVRLISKADYGLYQQFLLISTTLITVLGLGLNSSLYYFYPTGTNNEQHLVIKHTILIELIIGIAFVILFLGLGIPRLEWLNLENLNIYRIHIGLYILFTSVSSIVETMFTVEKNVTLNRFYHPFEKFIRLGLIISFIFFFQDNIALIYALLVLSGLKFIFVIIYSWNHLVQQNFISFPLLKNQLVYSIPIGISVILRTISVKIDKFIVNEYVDINDFAIYSIAFISIPVLPILYSSINNVVVAQIAVFCKEEKFKNAAALWRKTVLKNASITIPIVGFCFVMADHIIEILYTQRYLESANYFRIYILYFLFSMFSYGFILRGTKKTSSIFIIDLISAIITIISGIYLIQNYQMYGAAITAVMGISLPIIITVIYEKNLLKLPLAKLMNWKKLYLIVITSLGSLIGVYLISCFIENIYIAFAVAGIFYSTSVYYLQKKYDLFLFPDLINTIFQRNDSQ
ncbi:lipopolysaccharide biosynthesis protein [Candidatus Neomarinimicrobiota bacterium]